MPQTHALLIGVSDYSDLDRSTGRAIGHSDLAGALNDIRSMAMLVRMMDIPAENVRVLSSPLSSPNDFEAVANGRDPAQDMNMAQASFGPATKEAILQGLRWLSDRLQEPGSQGIVYFSGHSVVSTAGHPALAPSDVRLDASQVRSVPDTDFWTWMWRTVLVCAVDEITGSDAQRVKAFIDRFLQGDTQDPRARARQVAAELGIQDAEEGIKRFMRDLGNMGAGIGSRGFERDKNAREAIAEARKVGFSLPEIESVLYGDAFTDQDPLRGLISFNKAFYEMLRDIPETSPVQIILETCLQEGPGRSFAPMYAPGRGLPFANGNMTLFNGCDLGQASNLAVFDNRWHGAFTWALVSLLSQTAVKVYPDHRAFDVRYGQLTERIQQLLSLMGFEQRPFLSAQPQAVEWEVLGGEPGGACTRLEPVRKREEIDADEGGHIWEIKSGTDALGFLIVTPGTLPSSGITVNGVSLQTNREYWVWSSGSSGVTGSSKVGMFDLVRPPTAPSQGSDLKAWVDAQSFASGSLIQSTASQSFGGSSEQPDSLAWDVLKRPQGQGATLVARVASVSSGLKWYRPGGTLPRVSFCAGVVPPAGLSIEFRETPNPPSGQTFNGLAQDNFGS